MDTALTIVTPTYNRAGLLPVIYNSLALQTNRNFTWFVVDDGSTDGTQELIHRFQQENRVNIIYRKKGNAGKHTAINAAAACITSVLTFIVDSDDRLTPDAVEEILRIHKKYEAVSGLCGYAFLRERPDGSPMINKKLLNQEFTASFTDFRINNNYAGDMAEVWYSRCLVEYPFPEVPGERFIGEDTAWIKMAEKYNLVFINKVIYISDYLEGGLTQNRRNLNIKSPNGCVLRAEIMLNAKIKPVYKLKAAIQYIVYSRFAGNSNFRLFYGNSHRLLVGLAFPIALIVFHKWKCKYNQLIR